MGASWANLNLDGRRLDRIIRQMETNMKTTQEGGLNDDNISLYFAYLDRLLKATHEKVSIAETVLNVKGFLAQARRQFGPLPTDPPQGVIKVSK